MYFAIFFAISVTIVIAEPEVAELENGTASEKALREGKGKYYIKPVQVNKFGLLNHKDKTSWALRVKSPRFIYYS